MWCEPSDSSRRYGRVSQRARCDFSGETLWDRPVQGCSEVPCRIRIADFGQYQQERIMRVLQDSFSLRRQIYQGRSLQIVDQRPDTVALKDALELGIATGAPNLFNLVRAGDEFEASYSPGVVDEMGRTVWRDERRQQDVAVQDNLYPSERTRSRASSTARSICSGVYLAFSSLIMLAVSSKSRARTKSSIKRERSPFRPLGVPTKYGGRGRFRSILRYSSGRLTWDSTQVGV